MTCGTARCADQGAKTWVSPDSIVPGDTAVVSVELSHPIALEVGQRFAVREGGKTVGAGVVLKNPQVDSGWRRRASTRSSVAL
ncbi:MAG TPA: hypothetical protein VG994_11605 [Steroidobacteraceae bacterium]|nr:hypothetical protein [Steroidobacteraceae bacterium]